MAVGRLEVDDRLEHRAHGRRRPFADACRGETCAVVLTPRAGQWGTRLWPGGLQRCRPARSSSARGSTERWRRSTGACRVAALEGALAAGLSRSALFVNVEPETIATPPPGYAEALWRDAAKRLNVTLEITERALTTHPAELLRAVDRLRAEGWRIALDDVGADPRSLALVPILRPDVIKLDLRLVQARPTLEIAAIMNAVAAESERTGALVVAEGIETERHRATAAALGATLGQGWLFGYPAELPATHATPPHPLRYPRAPIELPGRTPYELVVLPTQVVNG